MNGPQWKSFQPPLSDAPILVHKPILQPTPLLHQPAYNTTQHVKHYPRETGVIEKLVTSYGFIRCNERKARIFFHFSEFSGDPETITVGDVVEFHTEDHPKTGKPLACAIVRFDPIPPPLDILSEEKFHGSLVKEAKPSISNGCVSAHTDGMLTYQNCGESFFVPYAADDLCGDPHMKLNPGDQLLFYVATDPMGNIRARQVELLVPVQPHSQPPLMARPPVAVVQPQFVPSQPLIHPPPPLLGKLPLIAPYTSEKPPYKTTAPSVTTSTLTATAPPFIKSGYTTSNNTTSAASKHHYQGVICSLKDTFGFIERADAVKEIFFHYSEYCGGIDDIRLGADVEFDLQIRNNKEVAIHISALPGGTVIFEDLGLVRYTGTVSKIHKNDANWRQTVPLSGRIVYETPNGQKELPFGDKDQNGDFTLMPGDVVRFSISTDRRDKLERASAIELMHETLDIHTNSRETGVVVTRKDGYGFIQCSHRDVRIFFHFSEIVTPDWQPNINDEVEFNMSLDTSSPPRQIAVRLRHVTTANPDAFVTLPEKYIGTVNTEPGSGKSMGTSTSSDTGKIVFDYKSAIKSIMYHGKDVTDQKSMPCAGDKIEFQICEQKRTQAWKAVHIKLVLRTPVNKNQGFIATLKDNFGFIEMADHEKEIFFHFSTYDGDPNDLDLGDEVDFTICRKSSKVSAENIRRLAKGTIVTEEIKNAKVLIGEVVRPMRMVNPDQEEYSGLVQAINEENVLVGPVYPYGVTSLADNRDFLQQHDAIKFQVASVKATGKERAVNVAAKRSYVRAKVDSVKGQYGFLNYDADVGKKLFFHMTEVHDNASVTPGDEVEFVVVKNQRNGKFSACSLRKISNTQRPDRLLTRLKSIHEAKPTFFVVRQPKGPDGTAGFHQPRKLWKPTTKA